jgi:hypothetical protein
LRETISGTFGDTDLAGIELPEPLDWTGWNAAERL